MQEYSMNDNVNHDRFRRFIPHLLFILALGTYLLIPLRLIGYGYIPKDDCLRHVAKAVSGRQWTDVLVLNPDVSVDFSPGWHALLRVLHLIFGFDRMILVGFSVVALWFIYMSVGLIFIRPEYWTFSLLLVILTMPEMGYRWMLGRPFIFSMATLVVLLNIWTMDIFQKKKILKWTISIIIIALSTWVHGSWYLFFMPVIAFVLARRIKTAVTFALCILAGAFLGSLLTGHPFRFLMEHIGQFVKAFGGNLPEDIQVSEFKQYQGLLNAALLFSSILVLKMIRNKNIKELLSDPLFFMIILSWILGLRAARCWTDWGVPSLMIWSACEFKAISDKKPLFSNEIKLIIMTFTCVTLFSFLTYDMDNRCNINSNPLDKKVDLEIEEELLPGSGGIIYSASMKTFYYLFYRYPNGSWRYILGYEPGLMPEDDIQTYNNIKKRGQSSVTFKPWIDKMRPEDRLVIFSGEQPFIPELAWRNFGLGMWFGYIPPKT